MTHLLQAWGRGDAAALDRLWAIVYGELRQLAHRQRRREFSHEALQTTALVHEAYLRLVDARAGTFSGRAHFFAIAARVMRQVLVDAARARGAQKRDGRLAIELEPGVVRPNLDVLELDEALQRLAAFDERQSRVVELRFFGGLTEQEAAEVLNISVPTLKREWTLARAWLFRTLSRGDA